MQIREQLEQVVNEALQSAIEDGTLSLETVPPAALERPRDESNGDWASTVAMRCAKQAKRNPREIAQIIVDHLPQTDMLSSVSIAGPGFINLVLSPATFQAVAHAIRTENYPHGKGRLR